MALSLKVFMVQANKTTTMRFNGEMSVAEATKSIREKTGEGGADHGIFLPPIPGKTTGRWLKDDRTLQYYDLTSGTEIHYKKKHRPLKIRLLDQSIRTMLVDDSQTVAELVETIGEKMNIANPEEFSLQVEGRPEGEWLNAAQSLHENGVPDDALLILRKKFFYSDQNVDRTDPMQLHLLYLQCRDAITAGNHPTQKDEAVNLAALQCQVEQKF